MFKAIYKLKDFFKKYKKNTIIAIIFLSLSYFSTFLKPLVVGEITDSIINKNIDIKSLSFYLLIFFISIFLTYYINTVWRLRLKTNGAIISQDTRDMIMKKLLKQYPQFFLENTTGSIMAKATTDVTKISDFVEYGIMFIFDGILYPLALILALFFISWKLAIFSLIGFPIFLYLVRKIDLILEVKIRKNQDAFYELNETSLEDISSIKVIRAFNVEGIFTDRFVKKVDNTSKAEMDANKEHLKYMPLATIFITAINTLSLLGGVYLIHQGELSVGSLITFTIYISFLSYPAFALADLFLIIEDFNQAVNRIDQILNYKEDINDIHKPEILKNPEKIEFKNYNFKYPNADDLALKNINLKFNKGDRIILVGKTGSGKSTLVKQLLRLYDKESGNLYINNIDIEKYERKSLISNISYLPQENFLFSKSIKENIDLFGDYQDEEINEALIMADLKKDIDTFPKEIDTLTGERGIALSGGQRQRIALARSLIRDTEILILDDVFSAVDTKTEKNIINNLNNKRSGRTNIFITHRLSIIKANDYVVVFDDGKIICQGNHNFVLKENKWYKEQYEKQVRNND